VSASRQEAGSPGDRQAHAPAVLAGSAPPDAESVLGKKVSYHGPMKV
jgi:hypothetical protein